MAVVYTYCIKYVAGRISNNKFGQEITIRIFQNCYATPFPYYDVGGLSLLLQIYYANFYVTIKLGQIRKIFACKM